MIHPKTPSPSFVLQRKKPRTSSGRNAVDIPKPIRLNEQKTTPVKVSKDVEETNTLGYFDLLEQEKAQEEMAKMLKQKKVYPIAPDAFIPNSTVRSMFKMKKVEPIEVKMFQLRLIPSLTNSMEINMNDQLKRYSVLTNFSGIHSTSLQILNKLDILENLQKKTNRNLNWQNEDDEWVELGDPESSFANSSSKPSSAKRLKNAVRPTSTLVQRHKDTMPDLFKRLKNEPWWRETDDEINNNPRSMLLQLIEILRDKEHDSYESACNYVVEIFRTHGMDPSIVNQILDILMDHLALSENDPLDIHTVRTVAQFMLEKKPIIITLLAFVMKCPSNSTLHHETINAIKFITDINNTEDIDLVLQNMPIVRDAADETFSLKVILDRIKSKHPQKTPSNLSKEGDENEDESLHPLLKKISEERWFPHDITDRTFDSILNAILNKLPNASKTMLKTLTTHLIQLHRVIGYSDEQFEKVSNHLIALLSHIDADYRLIAATVLAELGRETKAIDLALLQSFLNDPRILVRTECCDTLKRLTGITSDTILKDCADDLAYLETLPEDNFTIQNYLKAKNRLPTPPPPPPPSSSDEQQPIVSFDEEQETDVHQSLINDIHEEKSDLEDQDRLSPVFLPIKPTPISPSHYQRQISNDIQPTRTDFSISPSLNSPIEQPIRVEINEKTKSFSVHSSNVPQQVRKEVLLPSSPPPLLQPTVSFSQPVRSRKSQSQPNKDMNYRTSIKLTVSDQTTGRQSTLLPNSTQMWDSYAKQNELIDESNTEIYSSLEIPSEQPTSDPIQTILDEHKRNMGYFRSFPNRRVLIPHKISFNDVFADQSHITVDRTTSLRSVSQFANTMQLSDLNRNKRHLQEVEFVQLLSSMLIRAVQIHKKYERFIPGTLIYANDTYVNCNDALTISQMQLHTPLNFDPGHFTSSIRLPPIVREKSPPSSVTIQMGKMKSDAHKRAKKAGINLRKVKDMEDTLSHLLKADRDRLQSTFVRSHTHSTPTLVSYSDPNEVTHAWLFEQLLKSQGSPYSQHYIQQIVRAHPKFAPLLHSRIPQHLIPTIWNDPVLKRLAAIIANKPDDSTVVNDSLSKSAYTKTSMPTFDDEHSSNFFDYTASNDLLNLQQQKEEQNKNKYLPPVRGVKMRLPRHILKFGFRELEDESPEMSLDTLRDENISKSRRRRVYMHLMMSVNENMLIRHELVKNQIRQLLKTDYRSPSSSLLPLISRSSLCN